LEIGIISPFNVFPPTFGGAVRIYQLAKNLGELGCLVHLFTPENGNSFELRNITVHPREELNHVKDHYPIDVPGIRTHSISLAKLIKRLGCYKNIDIIQAQHLLTALQGLILKNLLKKPAILGEHNVETLLWRQIHRVEKPRWKRLYLLEKFACKSFNYVTVDCSFDKLMIQKLFMINPSKITIIPNGVDTKNFSPKKEDREKVRLKYKLGNKPVILFSGRLNWVPNVDALKIIFSKLYPTLKKRVPEIVFMIIGSHAPPWLIDRKGKDVIVTATTHHDVAAYINAADVCIAPMRLGSGTCFKVLEYMSCKKPVVSTSCGARGLRVISHKHMIIEDNIESFADHILHLLKNKSIATRLGEEARKLVENTYDWKVIVRKLMRIYKNLLS